MADRSVDVRTEAKASSQQKIYYPYPTLITAYAPTEEIQVRFHKKRVPTGGKAEPEVEKAFYSLETQVIWPQGTFRYEDNGGYIREYVGNLIWGFNAGSGNLNFQPAWPPNHDSTPVKYVYSGDKPGINPDLLSQAEVKALNKLRDKSGQTQLDVGIWFGERRETARLFAQGALGILNLARAIAQKDYGASVDVLRDVFGVGATKKLEAQRQRRVQKWLDGEKRRGWSTAQRTRANVEDAVLTYNLGVSPLVNDLQAVHQRLLTGDLTATMVVKSVAKHSITENGQRTLERTSLYAKYKVSQTTTLALTHGYTVTLKAIPRFEERARISKLGLANPINLVYQLTGLSFIVDYFVNLGPYLESINVPMEFIFSEGSRTQRFILNVTNEHKSSLSKDPTPGKFRVNFTERVLYTTFPVPIPPLSGRGKDLTAKQATNTGLIAMKKFRSLVGM